MISKLLDSIGNEGVEAPYIIGNVTDYNFSIRPKDLSNFLILKFFVSSSLTIVTGFRGGTRDLAITREQ